MHSFSRTLITQRHPHLPREYISLASDPIVSVLAAVSRWSQTRCQWVSTTHKSRSRFKKNENLTFLITFLFIKFLVIPYSPSINQNQSDMWWYEVVFWPWCNHKYPCEVLSVHLSNLLIHLSHCMGIFTSKYCKSICLQVGTYRSIFLFDSNNRYCRGIILIIRTSHLL